MNKESVGAHVFSASFAQQFSRNPQWAIPYNRFEPLTTPNGLTNPSVIQEQLARAVLTIAQTPFALDAQFGDVQFVERSLPNGQTER